MKKIKYPSISILTITYNPNLSIFENVLRSIKKQDYPKNKIEHIVVDGGSSKQALELMKKYKCKVLVMKNLRDQSEARRSYALKKAKNQIVFCLESDNILPSKNTLFNLIKPFMEDNQIIATYTHHYGYNKKMSVIDRYCALFGVSDPLVFYLGKADREWWVNKQYKKGKIIKIGKEYDVVEFNTKNLPTVGDNGFLTKREILLKAKTSPKNYLHIDVYVDLLKIGYKRFGVVKSTQINHVIGNSLIDLVKRRVLYLKRFSLSEYALVRRYSVLDLSSSVDKKNLVKYILFTVTIVEPLYRSIKGFLRIKDVSWFIHPLACWLFLIYYTRFTAIYLIKLKLKGKI